MWEKIVSNLLSNALKFTFTGEIAIELRALPRHIELQVRDTGVGIPDEEQPHIFQRFHRVKGVQARTQEGVGIGLALVRELLRLHHGRIRVRSQAGEGTTFTLWLPLGSRLRAGARPADTEEVEAEKRADGEAVDANAASPATTAARMAEQALQWTSGSAKEATAAADGVLTDLIGDAAGSARIAPLRRFLPGARVLVVDDNADMRAYLTRLLAPHWNIETAENGLEAWEAIRRNLPDLLLADVMMPGIDGFELLKRIRADETLKTLPVILVTARAGEESAIEGLIAGADDYIAKPFSARELIVRVGAQLELARMRRRAEEAERKEQERQAFLLKLSDALRPLADSKNIKMVAARVLGEHLAVNRAFYAEIENDDWIVAQGYETGVLPLPDGLYSAGTYGQWIMETYRAGGRIVFRDTQHDPRFSEAERDAHAAMAIVGAVGVPLVKEGKLVAILAVHTAESRHWTTEEIGLIEETAERTWAAVERARAEAALRESEERQAFLLKLSDALRTLSDPVAIQGAACEVLGEHTGANRALYAEVIDERIVTIKHNYLNGVPPIIGSLDAQAFGAETVAAYKRNEKVVFSDSGTDPRFSDEERQRYASIGVIANVSLPLVKDGRWVTVMGLHHATPREWTAAEIALVEDVAERTWAAVERARAEAALRESEAHLATELEDARVLQKISNQLVSEAGPNGHYNDIVEVARTLMRSDAASIQELDAVDSRLKLLAHTGFHAESAAFWAYVDADIGSSCGRALTAQKRVVVPDMDKFEADPHDIAAYRKSGIMSVQSTPLVASSGRIVGMLSTHWNHPHAPSAEGYRFFDILARLAADFMERARAEEALRESEEKFRNVFETIEEGFCIIEVLFDDAGNPFDYRFLETNRWFQKQTELADAIGKTMRELAPTHEQYWFDIYGRIARTGESARFENEATAIGFIYDVYAFRVGAPGENRVAVVFHDITERKRAEETLRENLEELTRLNHAAVPRELQIIEQKHERNELAAQQARKPEQEAKSLREE